MIIYGSPVSPYVRKALVFAAEKGVEVELVPVGRQSNNPDFRRASPFGKMPALSDGDFTLADSSAIVAYIEAAHPEKRLIPTEAKAHGTAIWFDEFADAILGETVLTILFNRVVGPMLGLSHSREDADRAEQEVLPERLSYLEKHLDGHQWLVGDAFGLADISVSAMLFNLPFAGVHLDTGMTPNLDAYLKRIAGRPSVKPSLDVMREFLESKGFSDKK